MSVKFLRRRLLNQFFATVSLLLLIAIATPMVTACEWDYLIWIIRSKSADPLYRFVQNGKAGYIDRSGRVVIKPQIETFGNFDEEFENGLLHLGVSNARYVDATGKLVINKDYSSAWDFSEGLAAAMPKGGNRWGYLDRSGEFVISPRFETYPEGYVYSFSDGFAMIEVGNKYGYIDRSGEFVIRPSFLYGADFHEGLARVIVEGPCGYHGEGPCPDFRTLGVDRKGPLNACKFAFIDKSGAIVTPERYDYAGDFAEGLAAVRLGDKWGYIDQKGVLTIKPSFDEAGPFSEGLARIKQGKLFGFINSTGDLVVKPQYEYAEDFSDGLAVVGRNWTEEEADCYYIDKSGQRAIAENFALASSFFQRTRSRQAKVEEKKEPRLRLYRSKGHVCVHRHER
jgi:hypothetical protein